MKPRVYISGPITKGNRTENFAKAAHVQAALIGAGYATLNPMLTMMHPEAWTIPHNAWMENDLPWVEAANAVLRLPGESVGAELECEHARKHGIPIFDNIDDLDEWKRYIWEREHDAYAIGQS